jgi:hypothetical protein
MISNPDFTWDAACNEIRKALMQTAIYLGDLGISALLKLLIVKISKARYRERLVENKENPNQNSLCELIYSETSKCFPESGHLYNMVAVCKCLYDEPIIVIFYYVKRYTMCIYNLIIEHI